MPHGPEVASSDARLFIKPTPIEVAQEVEEFVVIQVQILTLIWGQQKTRVFRSLAKTIADVVDISSKSG